MSFFPGRGMVSSANSSSTPLNASTTFTGTSEDVASFPSLVVACKTDQDGQLFVDFSIDGTNWDSTLTFDVTADVNEVHRITITRRYFRVRFTNTSLSNQTYLRLQCLLGSYQSLTSSLNSTIQQDADTLVVRPLDFNLMVGEGNFQNNQITIKDGLNVDIDTGSVPEDIWSNGGIYTGFPATAQASEVVSDSVSDTGVLSYFYLATEDDLDYTFAQVTLNGTTPVSLGHNIFRCNFAFYESGGTTPNVGNITIRSNPTPSIVFVSVPPEYGQSYCSAYSVPKGSSVYIDRITASVRGSASGSVDGVFYYKTFQGSPRYRFPFEMSFGTLYFDDMDYNVKIPEKVDIMPRIIFASANNLSVKASYRILKVKK
jgi:hypothetical protein